MIVICITHLMSGLTCLTMYWLQFKQIFNLPNTESEDLSRTFSSSLHRTDSSFLIMFLCRIWKSRQLGLETHWFHWHTITGLRSNDVSTVTFQNLWRKTSKVAAPCGVYRIPLFDMATLNHHAQWSLVTC